MHMVINLNAALVVEHLFSPRSSDGELDLLAFAGYLLMQQQHY